MIWVIIGQLTTVMTMIMLLAVNSRALGDEGVGHISLALTIVLLINQLVFNGVNATANRYFHTYDNPDLIRFISHIASLFLLKVKLMLVPITVLIFIAEYTIGLGWSLIAVSLVYGFLQGVFAVLNSICNASGQRKVYGISVLTEGLLRIIFSWVAVNIFNGGASSVLFCFVISSCIGIAVNIYQNKIIELKNIYIAERAEFIEHYKYSLPYSKWGGLNWAYLSADRWLIGYFFAKGVVGEYSYLYQLGYSPFGIFMAATMVYLTPLIYKDAKNNSEQNNSLADKKVFGITILAFISIVLSIPVVLYLQEDLLTFILGKNLPSFKYLYLFVVAGGLQALIHPISLLLNNRFLTDKLTLPKIITSILGVIGYYVVLSAGFEIQSLMMVNISVSVILIIWITLLYFRYKNV